MHAFQQLNRMVFPVDQPKTTRQYFFFNLKIGYIYPLYPPDSFGGG